MFDLDTNISAGLVSAYLFKLLFASYIRGLGGINLQPKPRTLTLTLIILYSIQINTVIWHFANKQGFRIFCHSSG